MKKRIYVIISLCIAFGIMYYLFQDVDTKELWENTKKLKIEWFVYSVLLGIIAFIARALRWCVQLEAEKLKVDGYRAFFSLMGGYLINLLLPRGGEVARGTFLKKTTGFSLPLLLGSILVERIVDVIILFTLLFVAFVIELEFFIKELKPLIKTINFFNLIIQITAVITIIVLILIFFKKKIAKGNKLLFRKIMRGWINFRKGMFSVTRLPNKGMYIFYTFIIWASYFLMTYIIIFSLPLEQHIPWYSGFTFLAMGALGMSMPVQGGIGTYHMMLATALTLYGISYEKGLVLATTMHISHTLAVIVIGGISIIIIYFLPKIQSKQ